VIYRRQLFIIFIAVGVVIVLADGLLTPPGQSWYERIFAESRTVENRRVVFDERDSATVRRAAQSQWNLAEWHFMRGEWNEAEREYKRLIAEFPYTDLDYGFRTDDARYRLDEVARLRRGEKIVPREAGPRR
jgi:hypothetical protein